jgi:hypothetical protein
MKFILPDDTIVVGNSYADIVRQMNEQKMTPARNQSTYRKALAKRAREMYGQEVDDTSDRALIKSLEKVGLIARV